MNWGKLSVGSIGNWSHNWPKMGLEKSLPSTMYVFSFFSFFIPS